VLQAVYSYACTCVPAKPGVSPIALVHAFHLWNVMRCTSLLLHGICKYIELDTRQQLSLKLSYRIRIPKAEPFSEVYPVCHSLDGLNVGHLGHIVVRSLFL
jgi:hypothetical protein